MKRSITDNISSQLNHTGNEPTNTILNFFNLTLPRYKFDISPKIECHKLPTSRGNCYYVRDLLTLTESKCLLDIINKNGWAPIPVGGSKHTYWQQKDKIGSFRASTVSIEFAELIWQRLEPLFGGIHIMSEKSLTEWEKIPRWEAIGISPVLRFVKYTNGCEALLPHYDESITFKDGNKSLLRVLLCISASMLEGGDTVFVKEPEIDKANSEMSFKNWKRMPNEEEVNFKISPQTGSALIFDHKMLHGSTFVSGFGEKVTLRMDLVFKKHLTGHE